MVRWAIAPLSAVAVIYAGFFLAVVGRSALLELCPDELIWSGSCRASWFRPSVDALIAACAFSIAVGVVLLRALIVPAHKLRFSILCYVCGGLYAIWFAHPYYVTEWKYLFVPAAIGGTSALRVAYSRWKVAPANPSGRRPR